MIIYGEYLFLENLISGLIILKFTAKVMGKRISKVGMILGGTCCGAAAFMIFLPVSFLTSLSMKIFMNLLISRLALGRDSLKNIGVYSLCFFVITCLYGGITLALIGIFSWEGIAKGGSVYLPGATYLTVTASALAAMLPLVFTIRGIFEKRELLRGFAPTTLVIEETKWSLDGFVDSGNFLKEPITGRPVAIVSRALMEEIRQGHKDMDARYVMIPYRAIGTSRGMLEGYRADYIEVLGKRIEKPVLAVWDEGCCRAKNLQRQILLPGSILERGIYAGSD